MPGKSFFIIAFFILGSLVTLMALDPTRKYVGSAFWVLMIILLIHLFFSLRGQKAHQQRIRRGKAFGKKGGSFWKKGGKGKIGGNLLVTTTACLNWDTLIGPLDSPLTVQLAHVSTSAPQTGDRIKPQLNKILSRLKKLDRHFPKNPGPAAAQGWAYSLLGQITARETLLRKGCNLLGNKFWVRAEAMYTRAEHLAPDDSHIPADRGRALEEQAALLEVARGTEAVSCLEQALLQYEKSLSIDPHFNQARRGRGRVLSLLSNTAKTDTASFMLSQAVADYEKVLATAPQDGSFYQEFALAVSNLAQYHTEDPGARHYQRAGQLFLQAADMGHQPTETVPAAGSAFQQAAELMEDQDKASELHLQAIQYLRQAVRLAPENVRHSLRVAQSLIALFQLPGHSPVDRNELLEEACTLSLCTAAASFSAEEDVWSGWAYILSVVAENNPEKAGQLWAQTAEKYKAAADCNDVSQDRAAANCHNWAYALSCLAETHIPGSRRLELLKESALKYEQASYLNGPSLVTLVNWGEVLGQASIMEEDSEESYRLHKAAEEKFKRAIKLYPQQASPWRRWSALLQDQAREEDHTERRHELWQAAREKLGQGSLANPDDPITWVIWGRLLSELYREGPEHEKPFLVAVAIEKYEKALSLTPEDDQAWNFLGRARLDAADWPLAKELQGSLTQLQQVRLAAINLQTACHLNADDDDHWAEWGRALFKMAQLMNNEASSLAALKTAEEKYLTAAGLKPEESEHRIGLSQILYQWGWKLENTEAQRDRFEKAYGHCSDAAALSPHNPRVWRIWAKVAEALANFEKDPHLSYNWLNEANEKDFYANSLEKPSGRSHHH